MPFADPALPRVPQALTRACAAPVAIPHRDLAAREAVRLWAGDRRSLADCRDRHGALADAAAAAGIADDGIAATE